MPSRYTADRSMTDAQALCQNFGIAFEVIAIEDMTAAYRDGLAPLFEGTQKKASQKKTYRPAPAATCSWPSPTSSAASSSQRATRANTPPATPPSTAIWPADSQ